MVMNSRFISLIISTLMTAAIALMSMQASAGNVRAEKDGFFYELNEDGTTGRVVFLHGANIFGNSKVPFPVPTADDPAINPEGNFYPIAPDALDLMNPLAEFGFNVVRLVFIWEAYEGVRGTYNTEYLDYVKSIAEHLKALNIHTIVTIHQDGYSRYLDHGCGDGFPRWTIADTEEQGRLWKEETVDVETWEPINNDPEAVITLTGGFGGEHTFGPHVAPNPDGSTRAEKEGSEPACASWALMTTIDSGMHESFSDFYANKKGVRTAYLQMLENLAAELKDSGVIGYDLLNEPWGDAKSELAPLYQDAQAVIRVKDPSAIVFLEPLGSTNNGILPSRLPRPSGYDNYAYAPHFYDYLTMGLKAYHHINVEINFGFMNMSHKAHRLKAPLFIGEFGMYGAYKNVGDYIDVLYERINSHMANGAQWNFTPNWDEEFGDWWNFESLSIVSGTGGKADLQPNYQMRPFVRYVAGKPKKINISKDGKHIKLKWKNDPSAGEGNAKGRTEIFVPRGDLYGEDMPKVNPSRNLTCGWLYPEVIACTSDKSGNMEVEIKPASLLSR